MQESAAVPRPPTPRPEGGKAFARLLMFEQERAGGGVTDGTVPPAADAAGTAGTAGTAGVVVPMPEEVAPLTAAIAEEYAATATALATAPAAGASAWRWLGPSYMPNGQTYGSAR